jgi:3-oxoacyl-[acyl-carrier-protein] synthase III
MSDIGLSSISYYLPNDSIDTAMQAQKVGADERLLNQKIGMKKLARKHPDETTSQLAVKAITKLCHEHHINLSEIQCLILVTQNPDDYGLPHTSAIIHGAMGLPKTCAAFDISLGCSGYVYGLSVLKSFMTCNGMQKGLLVTADPYSNIIDMQDKNTSLLFGDAATATLLEVDGAFKIGLSDFGTDGAEYESLTVNNTRKLTMDGRNIFNFSAQKVPQSIHNTLLKNNLDMSEIDQIILHQGSRYIVETIAERINAKNKTPFVAAHSGNTVSSSIPLALAKEQVLKKYNRIILSGFGVGLSWATTVLSKSIASQN